MMFNYVFEYTYKYYFLICEELLKTSLKLKPLIYQIQIDEK